MSVAAELLYSRRVPQVAVLALISFSFAGCSADMSSRMSQSNFSNPFAQESTGSVQQAPPPQRELPQYSRPQTQSGYYQSQPLPPAVSAPQSYPVAAGGVSGGGRGVASYAPPAQPHLETTATVPPRSVAAAQPVGGTKIIVGTSDTLDLLAKRYRVTPQAILAANGYKGPRALSPGQQLIIPHQATAAAPAPLMAPVAAAPALAPAARPVAAVAAPSSTHFVNHGDTLASIARKNHISAGELARANGLDPSAKLKLGARPAAPRPQTPPAAAPPAPTPVAGILQPVAAAPAPATGMAAAPQSARLAQATTNIEDKPTEAPAKAAEVTSALPTFRWPV